MSQERQGAFAPSPWSTGAMPAMRLINAVREWNAERSLLISRLGEFEHRKIWTQSMQKRCSETLI